MDNLKPFGRPLEPWAADIRELLEVERGCVHLEPLAQEAKKTLWAKVERGEPLLRASRRKARGGRPVVIPRWVKVGGILGGLGSAFAFAWTGGFGLLRHPAPVVASVATVEDAKLNSPRSAVSQLYSPIPPASVLPAERSSTHVLMRHAARVAKRAEVVSRPSPQLPEKSNLLQETQLLQAARHDLQLGLASKSYAEVLAHEKQFPAGQLTEEREALKIEALVELGQAERARSSALEFYLQYPRSPFWPALRKALGSE